MRNCWVREPGTKQLNHQRKRGENIAVVLALEKRRKAAEHVSVSNDGTRLHIGAVSPNTSMLRSCYLCLHVSVSCEPRVSEDNTR